MVDGWCSLCSSSLFHTTFGHNKGKHFSYSASHEDGQKLCKLQTQCSSLEWIFQNYGILNLKDCHTVLLLEE
jgi:hypothetical protein